MSKASRNKRIGIAVGLAAILGTFGFLLYSGVGDNLVYFLTPQELMAKGGSVYDAPVRLGGQVMPGSVQWDADALDLRFRLTDGTNQVEVHSRGAPPQMFRDGIGVVVEGRYRRSGVFESTSLMVKHSNEYRAPTPGHTPEEMYKSLIREPST